MTQPHNNGVSGMTNGPVDNGEQLEWRTPVLVESTIEGTTQHYFGAGIDNYEGSNPAGYGS